MQGPNSPAQSDQVIRVHTIHEFIVSHTGGSVCLWAFKYEFHYFWCIHSSMVVYAIDVLIYVCDSIFKCYLHVVCVMWIVLWGAEIMLWVFQVGCFVFNSTQFYCHIYIIFKHNSAQNNINDDLNNIPQVHTRLVNKHVFISIQALVVDIIVYMWQRGQEAK